MSSQIGQQVSGPHFTPSRNPPDDISRTPNATVVPEESQFPSTPFTGAPQLLAHAAGAEDLTAFGATARSPLGQSPQFPAFPDAPSTYHTGMGVVGNPPTASVGSSGYGNPYPQGYAGPYVPVYGSPYAPVMGNPYFPGYWSGPPQVPGYGMPSTFGDIGTSGMTAQPSIFAAVGATPPPNSSAGRLQGSVAKRDLASDRESELDTPTKRQPSRAGQLPKKRRHSEMTITNYDDEKRQSSLVEPTPKPKSRGVGKREHLKAQTYHEQNREKSKPEWEIKTDDGEFITDDVSRRKEKQTKLDGKRRESAVQPRTSRRVADGLRTKRQPSEEIGDEEWTELSQDDGMTHPISRWSAAAIPAIVYMRNHFLQEEDLKWGLEKLFRLKAPF